MEKIEWQQVGQWDNYLYRIMVHGGWVVRYSSGGEFNNMCFVSDPNHDWKI